MFELIERIQIDGDRAAGRATIGADHPLLADHFPGRPLLPGTWLVELAAQVAGPLAEEVTRARHAVERWAILAMVEHAKLYAPVDLPATIEIEATIMRSGAATASVRASARHGDRQVLRVDLTFALVETPVDAAAAVQARHERLARWKAAR